MALDMKLFGIEVSTLDLNDTCDLLFSHLDEGAGVFIREDLNAHKVNLIKEDLSLRSFILGSDIVNADGISLVLSAVLLQGKIIPRVTGCDLFQSIIQLCRYKNRRVFLLGAKNVVLEDLIVRIEREQGLDVIAGYRDGYFDDLEVESIIQNIDDSGADFVFVGMPSPQKEMFEAKIKQKISRTMVLMGVGGSFDVLSGHVNRAPKIVQKAGLEWLFRLVQEPRRLWKRYFFGNTKFLAYLMAELVGKYSFKRSS